MKKCNFLKQFEYKIDRLKRQRETRKKRKAIETLKKLSEDSCLVKKFKEEVEYSWKDDKDGMCSLMASDVIEILSLIALQGDSGFSIGWKKGVLKKALEMGVLSPLTFKEDEFRKLDYCEDSYQNKRLASVFKEGDRYYDIDALSHRIVGTYDVENGELDFENKGCWHGPLIIYMNGEFHYIETSIINFDTYTGDNSFVIPALEVKDGSNCYSDYMFYLADYKSLPKSFFEDYKVSPKSERDDDKEIIYCDNHKDELLKNLKKVINKSRK